MNAPIGSGKRRSSGSHLRTLRRRRDYLRSRIDRADEGTRHDRGDYDRAEYHALEWAIQSLETVHDATVRPQEGALR